jgi:hypothetical protein
VDQASADVQTETQKPQNQKNNENSPKHVKPPVLLYKHLNSETDRGWARSVHSTTGGAPYLLGERAVRRDEKLLPAVTHYIRSIASTLLRRIAQS